MRITHCVLSVLLITTTVGESHADDIDSKESKWKKTYLEWRKSVASEFARDWATIVAAEARARPIFTAAKRLAVAGKRTKAEAKFLKARSVLFNVKGAAVIPLRRGLSYEIAIELATLYADAERTAKAKRELTLVERGRKFTSRSNEQLVRLDQGARAMERAYRDGERAAARGEPPPRKLRIKTREVSGYLRYRHGKVWSEEGDKIGDRMKAAAKRADAKIDGQLYEDLGGTRRPQFHQSMYPAEHFKVGKAPIEITAERVTRVSKRTAILDFRKPRRVAYDCKSTGRIREITRRGRFRYHKTCKSKTERGGHQLTAQLPPGLQVRPGDSMTFYAQVKKVRGSVVTLGRAAVVHVSRKGRTIWLYGVKTRRPVRVEATAAGFDLFDDERNQAK